MKPKEIVDWILAHEKGDPTFLALSQRELGDLCSFMYQAGYHEGADEVLKSLRDHLIGKENKA